MNLMNENEFEFEQNKSWQKFFNDINIYYLGYEYKKKITECNKINSVNPHYLRIKDMKDQFKKGESNNFWWCRCFKKICKYLEKY